MILKGYSIMNKKNVIILVLILVAAFIGITTAAFVSKPEINKTIILRLMQ